VSAGVETIHQLGSIEFEPGLALNQLKPIAAIGIRLNNVIAPPNRLMPIT